MMQPDKPEFTTARKHLRRNEAERISTGSKNIDYLLYGGVETRAVTEFYGAPGSGKTVLCHTMSVLVPQDKSDAGVCAKSIYIDTEGTFRTERIAVIAKTRGFDLRKTVDNIIIEQPEDSNEQERVLDNIDSLLKNKDKTDRFKLLVVDSPVTHYRSEYIGSSMLPARQQKLYRFMRRLGTIAQAYNIAVVVTNQMNTTQNSKIYQRPAGGNVMGHTVTYSVRLWTNYQRTYHAKIVSSPYHPPNYTTFYIRNKGLVDDNPGNDEEVIYPG
jgi:DNA repair protein RadA